MELGGAKRCGGDFEVFLFYFFIGGWGGPGGKPQREDQLYGGVDSYKHHEAGSHYGVQLF